MGTSGLDVESPKQQSNDLYKALHKPSEEPTFPKVSLESTPRSLSHKHFGNSRRFALPRDTFEEVFEGITGVVEAF